MRVIVAEDDRATARILSGLISSWGYEPVLADSGIKALELLADDSPPQLALLDWMLPGLDGPEVCKRLRAMSLATPVYVILLTAKTGRSDVAAGLDAGADDYVTKPFDAIELRARLSAGARIIDLQQRLANQVRDLEIALANVRKLTGLLPICAYCHSIRDDTNYWHRVEEYVSEHAEGVTFSHSICPKCFPKVEAEMAEENES